VSVGLVRPSSLSKSFESTAACVEACAEANGHCVCVCVCVCVCARARARVRVMRVQVSGT